MREDALRDQLARLLDWEDAHVGFDNAAEGVAADKRGVRAAAGEHTPWQLIEHIRLAQEDIVDFCVNPQYEHKLKWPDDYWPAPAPPSDAAWNKSLLSFTRSREKLKALAHDVADLTATVPTGSGNQTYLRAILLAADHTAYHVGQLVALRRALGIWK
jgi:hypothetical protein